MDQEIGFWKGLNNRIDDRADDYVADRCNSILRLFAIAMWAMFVLIATLSSVAVCLICLWLPSSYPWYAIPAAILSPLTILWSFHVINHTRWHLANL